MEVMSPQMAVQIVIQNLLTQSVSSVDHILQFNPTLRNIILLASDRGCWSSCIRMSIVKECDETQYQLMITINETDRVNMTRGTQYEKANQNDKRRQRVPNKALEAHQIYLTSTQQTYSSNMYYLEWVQILNVCLSANLGTLTFLQNGTCR